jgi:hypothetical protein
VCSLRQHSSRAWSYQRQALQVIGEEARQCPSNGHRLVRNETNAGLEDLGAVLRSEKGIGMEELFQAGQRIFHEHELASISGIQRDYLL